MHGFLARDGISPSEFRALALQQLERYDNVELWEGEVTDVARDSENRFRVVLNGDRSELARKMLIATGVMDQLPALPRIEAFWGKSVHQCPYCDGWELRGAPIAVYGKRSRGLEMARAMTAWTSDIALCTDGPAGLKASDRQHLARNGVELIGRAHRRPCRRKWSVERSGFRERPETAAPRIVFRYAMRLANADRTQVRLPTDAKGQHSLRAL